MSEREVRKYAWHKTGCKGATYLSLTRGEPQCSCGYEEASCQAPDVVVLLRWARAEKEKHEDEQQEAQRKRAGILPEADELYAELAYEEEGAAHIYSLVIAELEKTVRLTDDGWKWVDEADN